jgi:hypothetical protein
VTGGSCAVVVGAGVVDLVVGDFRFRGRLFLGALVLGVVAFEVSFRTLGGDTFLVDGLGGGETGTVATLGGGTGVLSGKVPGSVGLVGTLGGATVSADLCHGVLPRLGLIELLFGRDC